MKTMTLRRKLRTKKEKPVSGFFCITTAQLTTRTFTLQIMCFLKTKRIKDVVRFKVKHIRRQDLNR